VQLQIGAAAATLSNIYVTLPPKGETAFTALESGDGSAGVDLLAASEVVTFDLEKMFYRIDK
jgi:hypothetical protein